MTSTQDEIGKKNTIAVILSHVAVFLVAAPIIEAVADVIVVSLVRGIGIYSPFKFLLGFLLHTISSYISGGLAALFTGLVVGISSLWIRKAKWLFLLAAIVGGVSLATTFFTAFVIKTMYSSQMNFNQIIERAPVKIFILVFITGAVSAVICTVLTKFFQQNEQPPSSQAAPHPNVAA